MIISRTVFLNPVEPEYLAFRFSQGIDTKVEFNFKNQSGAAITEDLVAQMQMTGRSDRITEYLPCPSTDTVNGKARLLIPAGLRYDPNGWQLRLTGTVNREPRVVAYGLATAVAGAGPQFEPQDVIDTIDLNFFYGNAVNMTVKLWADEQKYTPYDLSGVTVSASTYVSAGGAVLVPFTITTIAGNAVTLTMTSAQVDTLPSACWWTLVVSSAVGTTTLVQGNVTVTNP